MCSLTARALRTEATATETCVPALSGCGNLSMVELCKAQGQSEKYQSQLPRAALLLQVLSRSEWLQWQPAGAHAVERPSCSQPVILIKV